MRKFRILAIPACLLLFHGRCIPVEPTFEIIYTSTDLEGHIVSAECNPGGGSDCPCTNEDVAIASFDGYGEVTSNPRERPTWVNAIGGVQFVETLPDGAPVAMDTFRYRGEARLPTLPNPDPGQLENAQAVHFMMLLWDGRDALFEADKTSLEAAIYWNLNAWMEDCGSIKVYTTDYELIDTGITVEPDTEWHRFEMTVDFARGEYVSIAVDGVEVDLAGIAVLELHRPDWGDEVAVIITTESMATWPHHECTTVHRWTTQFRDIEFGYFRI